MVIKIHFFNESIKLNNHHLPEDIEQVITPFIDETETIEIEEDIQGLPDHMIGLVAPLYQLYVRFLNITQKFKAR